MFLRKKRREVPGLNTTSTADISFMLLIFFLVTTSMEIDTGMPRQLPPDNRDEKQEARNIDRKLVMTLHLSKGGEMTANDEPIDIDNLRPVLKKFIVKTGPEHVIELITERDVDYDTYFRLQNQIMRSYRELRDAMAMRTIGCDYAHCRQEQKDMILQTYPQRITEK